METRAAVMTLKQVVEALVFASPKPMSVKEIVAALKSAGKDTDDPAALALAGMRDDAVVAALLEIQADFAATGRAFQLVEQVNGWSYVSDPGAAPWIRQLYPEAKPTKLTGPQLETLAIIAYRQPVTRADIEAVRGVAVDGVMQILLDRALVKIAGRAEVPGRPLLYQTSEYFLQHFGLKNTNELPNADELKRIALPTAPVPPAAAGESSQSPVVSDPPASVPAPESTVADAAPETSPTEDNSAPEDPSVPVETTGAPEATEPRPSHEN